MVDVINVLRMGYLCRNVMMQRAGEVCDALVGERKDVFVIIRRSFRDLTTI